MRDELSAGWVETQLGRWLVACTEVGVCRVCLVGAGAERELERWRRRVLPGAARVAESAGLARAREQLTAFARGERRQFDLPTDLFGTEFQRAVWAELQRIPFGVTRTYGQVASALGRPGASRAVGMANHHNPVPIVVPCHRVVASQGLGGFGGGVETKRRLLALEGALLPFG